MKKKLFVLFIVLLSITTSWAQSDAQSSELNIYNELNIYANAQYYPGVLEQAELLEKNYPQSVFIVTARIAKGQALIALNRFEEAEETFIEVLSSLRFGAEDYAKCWYYLGRAYYADGDYTNAISAFHTVCDVEQRENKLEYYHSSILFAGRIQFFMELYSDSVPLLEYVVSNGNYFTKPEYDEAVQKLAYAYNNIYSYDKTIKLYNKLSKDDFSDNVYASLTINAAEAYEKSGQTEKAYQILQANNNEDFKEMLCSYRLNLGAAAYNKKDYQSAAEYFSLAKESAATHTYLTAFIYQQKIELDTQGKAAAEQVEKALLIREAEILQAAQDIPGLADSYNSLLMRTKAFTGQNEDALAYYERIEKPGAKDVLTAATILSKKSKAEAESLIAPFIADTDCAVLYARLLCANAKYSAAEEVYARLEKNKKLDADSRIEYAKVLYRQKKWNEALRVIAAHSSHPLFPYVSGLCQYNLKNYSSAYDYLDVYGKSKTTVAGYKKLAHFYKGVSAYKEGKYSTAYSDLSGYVKAYTDRDEYLYTAYELAAKSALMQSDFKNAAAMARGMITASLQVSQKQNAVIYCSEILADCKDYDGAIALLSEYTAEKSDFAVKCISAIARVYEKKGELEKADSQYSVIQRDYTGTEAAEDAAYRSGEIYYSAERFSEAETRFTKYIYNYVNGHYVDAAYYFSGDCNMRLGELDKAIMQNTTLVSKYPASIYSYGAYKNLLQAYYEQENYRDALSTARLLVRDYKDQATSDQIGQRVVDLERIVSGTDREVVEKLGEYERAEKTASKKGRNAGSQLVKLYAGHDENEKALELALELLEYQKDGDEMYYAAENADFAAGYYYKAGESKKAAEYYLKAAEYYRTSGQDKDDKAAAALYSAVDSFVSAGLRGDAQVTANLLVELYPNTKQGQKVMNLLK